MKVPTKTQNQVYEYQLLVKKLNKFSGEKLHLEKTRLEKLSTAQKTKTTFLVTEDL